jgi:uncharacterized protein (TIGR02145 family)
MIMKTKITLFAMLLMSTLAVQSQSIMNIHQSNGTVLQIPLNTIDSITYTIPNPGNLATISTLPIGNITVTSATSGGNITNNGGTPVTQRGVVWGTSPNPTTANNSTSNGSGTGSFTSNLTGLTASTTYYVRAYATNSAGTAYGNELSFTTTAGGSGIVSNPGAGVTFDGYTYSSVVLGNGQEWMGENLKSTIYRNGEPIPNIVANVDWMNLTSGAWAYYENSGFFDAFYGKLYNAFVVGDARGVCPTGWNVPTIVQWQQLIDYLGGNTVAGGLMKITGSGTGLDGLWYEPNEGATNESGLSFGPSGSRFTDGDFMTTGGNQGWWWSSNAVFPDSYDAFTIDAYSSEINSYSYNNNFGFSIRCIKD